MAQGDSSVQHGRHGPPPPAPSGHDLRPAPGQPGARLAHLLLTTLSFQGFFCKTEDDFDDWCQQVKKVGGSSPSAWTGSGPVGAAPGRRRPPHSGHQRPRPRGALWRLPGRCFWPRSGIGRGFSLGLVWRGPARGGGRPCSHSAASRAGRPFCAPAGCARPSRLRLADSCRCSEAPCPCSSWWSSSRHTWPVPMS